MRALTAVQVARLRKPGLHSVGDGCYLQIRGSSGRSWVFRYKRDNKSHWMGLGSASIIPLAMARARAREARRLLLDGVDPLDNRNASRHRVRLDAAKAITFQDAAERYIAAHEASWGNPEHRRQWRTSLASFVYPVLGDLPVAQIDTALVLKALEPIWSNK